MGTRAMDIEQVARLLLGDDAPAVLAKCADPQTFLVNTLERSIDSLYSVTDCHLNTKIYAGKDPTFELGFLYLYSESLYFVILRLAVSVKRVSNYSTQDALELVCKTIRMFVLLTGVEESEGYFGFTLRGNYCHIPPTLVSPPSRACVLQTLDFVAPEATDRA